MEEILASIRQIVADEPAKDGSVAEEIPANPLVPRSAAKPPPGGTAAATSASSTPPSLDRLNGVLKSGPLAPTSPLGSKRPLPFDQDLADMLDVDGPVAHQDVASMAPKPEIRMAELLSAVSKAAAGRAEEIARPAADTLAADTAAAGGLATDKLALNGAAEALPPLMQPAVQPTIQVTTQPGVQPAPPYEPSLQVPPPFAAAGDVPAPPRNTSFPPLRTKGFFPVQPPPPPVRPLGTEPSPYATAAPMQAPPPQSAAPAFTAPAPAAPASYTPPQAQQPAHNGAFSNGAFGGAPLNGASAYPAAPNAAQRSVFEAARHGYRATEAPSEPAPVVVEAVDIVREAHPYSGGRAPDPAFAAAQALDALAQGLAASAAHSAGGPATPLRLANPVEQIARSALTLPAQPDGTVRTLEDAVADMLRPMLQQWVADNMPRIIERALRVEVASTTKPKPPGY